MGSWDLLGFRAGRAGYCWLGSVAVMELLGRSHIGECFRMRFYLRANLCLNVLENNLIKGLHTVISLPKSI